MKESTCVDVLTTEIVVGTVSVIVVTSPDIVRVNVVEIYDVDTTVVGTRTVLKEITVGPGTVVGTVVGKVSVVVRTTVSVMVDVIYEVIVEAGTVVTLPESVIVDAGCV